MKSWIAALLLSTGLLNAKTLLVRHNDHDKAHLFHMEHRDNFHCYRHSRWHAVDVPPQKEKKVLQRFAESTLFSAVHWDREYSIERTPNDPMFAQMWGFKKIEAERGWDIATSNEVVVAVIDTGVDFTHPDLRDNLWSGPQGEHGYTATNGLNVIPGGAEVHYHGTHVAGTIGARGNNNVGVVGIAWRTKIMSLQFIQASGSGFSSHAALLIEKMIDLRQSGVNVRVSNNSWGSLGNDPFLEEVFQAATEAGILMVCAAGNNNIDTDDFFFTPACLPVSGIVSVLASDENDAKAYFSNYGIETTDLFAPGTAILSCRPAERYWALQGTSMASPHVAGAAAMLFHLNPSLTVDQAKSVLLHPDSYDRTSFTASTTGGGRLNLRKLWGNPAVHNPPPANHSPTLTVSPADNPIVIPVNTPTTFTASGTDPDGDPLTFTVSATAWDDNWIPDTWWEVPHYQFSGVTNRHTVSMLDLALDQKLQLRFGASDGRGGGSRKRIDVWAYRNESKVRDLLPRIAGFRVWQDGNGNFWYRLDMNTNGLPQVWYGIEVRPQSSPWGWGYHGANQDVFTQIRFPEKGAYSVRPFIMDRDGNMVTGPQAVLVVSNSTARPPTARLSLNTKRGKAPLEIVADLSASSKGSAVKLQYGAVLRNASAFQTDIWNPVRRFTITEPGVYEYRFYVAESNGPVDYEDYHYEFITVLPNIVAPPRLVLLSNPLRLQVQSERYPVTVEGSVDLRSWSSLVVVHDATPVVLPASGRFLRGWQ